MIGPLYLTQNLSDNTIFFIYFFIGIGFGFFLERGGFGNSRKLALQFYLRDSTVFKVMFTAIITGMIGLAFMNDFGWIDLVHFGDLCDDVFQLIKVDAALLACRVHLVDSDQNGGRTRKVIDTPKPIAHTVLGD